MNSNVGCGILMMFIGQLIGVIIFFGGLDLLKLILQIE